MIKRFIKKISFDHIPLQRCRFLILRLPGNLQIFCLFLEGYVFGVCRVDDNAVGNTLSILVNMDEGDEAINKEIFVGVVHDFHVRHQASPSCQDDLAFKADDGSVVDRFHKEHPVNVHADYALRIGEACRCDKTRLDKPHRHLSRKQCPMVVKVVALHHMVGYMCFEFH
jgi:hypothetical protein